MALFNALILGLPFCSNNEPSYAPLPQRKVAVATLYAGDATEWTEEGAVPPVLAGLYTHVLGLTGRPDVLLLHLPHVIVDEAVFGIEETTGSSVIRVQLPSLTTSGKNKAVADAIAQASSNPGACPRPITDRRLAQYIVAHLLRLPQVVERERKREREGCTERLYVEREALRVS